MDRARLSFNQYTCKPWSLEKAVDACVRREIPAIAIWRDKIAEAGLARAAAMVRDAGLRVSSVCRGGFFPSPSAAERARRIDDNRRAIEEAAALGAPVLVLVCGPAEGQPLHDARAQVAEGIAALAGDAAASGVRLGDRAAASDDDRGTLRDREPRRGERPRGAFSRRSGRRDRRRLPHLLGRARRARDRARGDAHQRLPRQRLDDAARRRHRRPRDARRRLHRRRRARVGRSPQPATAAMSRSKSSTQEPGAPRPRRLARPAPVPALPSTG